MSLRGDADVAEQLSRGDATGVARESSCLLVIRASLGVKVGFGAWLFNEGEVLDGIRIMHPVNASRKLVIRTNRGTFNVNEEDVKKL